MVTVAFEITPIRRLLGGDLSHQPRPYAHPTRPQKTFGSTVPN
jgi:hypothetical protein